MSSITGSEVTAVAGSTRGSDISCHWSVTDATDVILAQEAGALSIRLGMTEGRGHELKELGKTGYLATVDGAPVVIWGRRSKGSDAGYALSLAGSASTKRPWSRSRRRSRSHRLASIRGPRRSPRYMTELAAPGTWGQRGLGPPPLRQGAEDRAPTSIGAIRSGA